MLLIASDDVGDGNARLGREWNGELASATRHSATRIEIEIGSNQIRSIASP